MVHYSGRPSSLAFVRLARPERVGIELLEEPGRAPLPTGREYDKIRGIDAGDDPLEVEQHPL